MLVRTDTPKLLLAGMKTEFMKAYDDEVVPEYEKIATVIKSDSNQETYPWLIRKNLTTLNLTICWKLFKFILLIR